MKNVLLIFTLSFNSLILFPQSGSLDVSFDFNGTFYTNLGPLYNVGRSVAVQANGKIVIAGSGSNSSDYDFGLIRLNTDGSLDITFDSDGKLTTDFGTDNDDAYSAVIQPDNKILAGGTSRIGSNDDFVLARYNTDGSLDATFDTDGKVITPIGSSHDRCRAIVLQSNGKILAAGSSFNGIDYDFALLRYNTDGSLDLTFDTDGMVTTPIGSGDDEAMSVTLQSDGKIVIAGISYNGTNEDFAVVRYNSDGSLDNTFDTDGKLTTSFGAGDDIGQSVTLQYDGKIVVAGSAFISGTNDDFAIARYNLDGSLDNTFSTDGKVTTNFSGVFYDNGKSVVIQVDGKILVSGSHFNASNYDFAVARYNNNGSLDNTFDTDGKVTTSIGSTNAGTSIALQTDGKILVVGDYIGAGHQFAAARYNNSIGPGLSTESIVDEDFEICIYPNPFIQPATIQIKGDEFIMDNVELRIYDAIGKEVYIQYLNSKTEALYLSLPSGTYLYKIFKNNKEVARGKGKIII
jgi:uncharacterized delta-60 repeat protein